MALISCNDVAFAYEGNIVIQGLNFTVNAGDYLCIVGENGSGKSTLMKGLLGLMKPQSGRIITGDGLEPTHIGYLPQQSAAQKEFPASVFEVVLSGRLNSRGARPFYSKADKRAAEENIDRLGLADLRKKSFRELSGGQQQRVLLGRALCATKRLLLLDEPVSGLDPLVTAELYKTIQDINSQMSITIIMVSHDIRAATEYASHILHLRGEQLFFGVTAEYKKTDVGRRFLGGGGQDDNSAL